jgi:predicted SnoaL-like aldol condensation-catalyzing enzyme
MGMRMTRHLLLAGFALALAACSASQAPQPPRQDAATQASRAAITDYARLLMVERKPEDAFGKYYADLLIQHDPWIGDGGKGDVEFLRKRREENPGKYDATEQYVTTVHNILADGDLVAIVSHVFTSPTDKGRKFVDIWRMENGKFAEHWDIIQPMDAASAATVGCGVGGTYEAAKGAGDTVSKQTCGAPDPKADSEASRRAVLAWLADRPDAANSKIARVLADGDLVLVHRLVTGGGDPRGTVRADLFRVKDGKIADHWEVIQPVPEFSASGRSMTGGPDDPLEAGRVKRPARPGEE